MYPKVHGCNRMDVEAENALPVITSICRIRGKVGRGSERKLCAANVHVRQMTGRGTAVPQLQSGVFCSYMIVFVYAGKGRQLLLL